MDLIIYSRGLTEYSGWISNFTIINLSFSLFLHILSKLSSLTARTDSFYQIKAGANRAAGSHQKPNISTHSLQFTASAHMCTGPVELNPCIRGVFK